MNRNQLERLRQFPLGNARNRIRAALEIADVKQVDVCRETGIPAPNMSEIVNGRYVDLNLTTCQRIAAYFDVPVDVLFPAQEAEGR